MGNLQDIDRSPLREGESLSRSNEVASSNNMNLLPNFQSIKRISLKDNNDIDVSPLNAHTTAKLSLVEVIEELPMY